MKELRDAIGITQQQLADYMGVARSTVTRSENNTRNLPDKSQKAGWLYVAAVAEQTSIPPQIVEEEAKLFNALKDQSIFQLEKCELQLMKADRLLKSQQDEYLQCCRAMQAMNTIKPGITGETRVDRLDNQWFVLLELNTLEKLETCGTTAQKKTRMHIKLLQTEIKELQAIINGE